MKKWAMAIVLCVAFLSFQSGCGSITIQGNSSETNVTKYYQKEDFQFIVIGKSTFNDVANAISSETIQVTSYGGFCEYPLIDGGYIRVKFYGNDMVVGDIETVSLPLETD